MKEIIAYLGKAGSGKDYQCQLREKEGYKKLAFADALRDIAFSTLEIDSECGKRHYEWLKANSCITVITPEYSHAMNFRSILEELGTQGIRKYDPDFWVRALIKTIGSNEKICISDMRFLNEYKGIKEFSENNDYKFTLIYCDYRSDRYQENNPHESAWLANELATYQFKDLEEIPHKLLEKIILKYPERI